MTARRRRMICLLPVRILVISFLLLVIGTGCDNLNNGRNGPPADQDGYLFCFWNVENLFDDRNDGLKSAGDREYDGWMARDPAMLNMKLAKLSEALLKMNGGRGPDILALAEVESKKAAELLKDRLNSRIADAQFHYKHVIFKEVRTGRHIANAILSRFPVRKNSTKHPDKRRRILQTVLVHEGHEIMIFASHWTSRLRGGEDGRAAYANKLYGAFRAAYHKNPNVDVLICGDFNDTPHDVAVTGHLRATGDQQAVISRPSPPLLFNLVGDKSPNEFGTYFYRNKWYIYDHIVVSPGMLDEKGWRCRPETVATVRSLYRTGDHKKRPWRFGSENEKAPRGYSDHFPVTIRLKVEENGS